MKHEGGAVRVTWVAIRPSESTVDMRYQREFDQARAKAMAKGFDERLVGAPVLSRRHDGKTYRVDGQHRLGACELAGFDEPVMSQIYDGLSLQEEAALFRELQKKRKAPRIWDDFKAGLVAKDPECIAINKTVKDCKLIISSTQQPYGVCAVDALRTVHHRGNLPDTLEALRAWSKGGDPSYFEGDLIRSLSLFLSSFPDASTTVLVGKLRGQAPDHVMATIKRTRGAWKELSFKQAAVSVLRAAYNLRNKDPLPLPTDLIAGRERPQGNQ